MTHRPRRLRPLLAAALAALSSFGAHAAIIVNGSLEAGTWSNTACNYMALAAGSTAITGWTVGSSATGPLVWAQATTCDGFNAADGTRFVDLSGFGAQAGPASLDQTMINLVVGQTYTVGIDYLGAAPGIAVDGAALNTSTSNAGVWTHTSATFVATAASELLSIRNISASPVVFIDNISVAGPETGGGSVPAPSTIALAAAGLVLLRAARRGRS